MRLFVALWPDDGFAADLEAAQKELRRQGGKGAFPPVSSLHLTLAFLGKTPRVEAACRALGRLEGRPLSLAGEGLGRFSRREGDLWWAAVGPRPPLEALHRRLAALLAREGFALEDRPFLPHITLARRMPPLEAPPAPAFPHPWRADRVVLVQSVLGQGGPSYRPLMTRPLEGPAHG